LLVALCAGLILPGAVAAADATVIKARQAGLSPEGLHKLSAAVKQYIKEGRGAGVIVLVFRHGKVAFFAAQGVRDAAAGKPMEKDTICRIYSMTKPITTVAAMMLWEEGRFGLDDPVSKYLPEFKDLKVYAGGKDGDLKLVPPRREMTVRDLMRHTSGLTYGFFGDTPVDRLYRKEHVLAPTDTLQTTVEKLAKIPLLYQPGTRFNYSVSTDVLARLIEVVSKKRLDQFFSERIFDPLDMKDTGFYVPEGKQDRLAAVHGRDRSGKLVVTESPVKSRFLKKPSLLSGGGGLVSTARDYGRFCRMLLGGGQLKGRRLLRANTIKMMTKNQLPADANQVMGQTGVGFGLGFSVRFAPAKSNPGTHVGEYGWGGAASTHFWLSPKDDLFVVALQQFMPFHLTLEMKLKPLIYAALEDAKK
jgi:CubicO group peptidase (beta-lactamase class C family)